MEPGRSRALSDRTWRAWVAALALAHLAPAAIVLALNGRSFLGYKGLAYGPPTGDAYGYYAAAREFISAAGRSKALAALAALLVVAGLAAGHVLWHRYGRRAEAVVAVALGLGVAASLAVAKMGATGAGAVGWPVVWAIPLAPLRAAHVLDFHKAYYVGQALSLAANVVTLVATALVARRLAGGGAALVAPALLAAWPWLVRLVGGTGTLAYGAWLNDLGVTLYAEPLSTALVATALALLLLRPDPAATAGAGALLGFACAVRPSNVTIAAVAFLFVLVARRLPDTAAFVVAATGPALVFALYWSRGYGSFGTNETKQAPHGLFSLHYLLRSWRDSPVFDWKMLVILLPFPLVGAYALRRAPKVLLLLAGTVVVTAAFYSAYYITALHARFLFVALPALFVLAAAGAGELARLPARAPAP